MADPSIDALRLANRYGGSIPSLREAAGTVSPPVANGTPPAGSEGSEEARLAKRYPSLGNAGQAVKGDRPYSGRGAPPEQAPPAAEVTKAATEAKVLTPAEQLEREQLRLAKRYGSIPDLAQDAELQAPEGLDAKSQEFGEFKAAAKELGLDKTKAGRLLELHQRVLQSQELARDQEAEAWRKQTEADPEIMAGTDSARELVKAFGGKDLVEALGPLGNHPTVVKSFVRIAKALEEARGGRW